MPFVGRSIEEIIESRLRNDRLILAIANIDREYRRSANRPRIENASEKFERYRETRRRYHARNPGNRTRSKR